MDTAQLSRFATMNTSLLKELSAEEICEIHPTIDDPAQQLSWVWARKTQPIIAKGMWDIIADNSMVDHLVLATLEGFEKISPTGMVCMGVGNDIWQQTQEKLSNKYVANPDAEWPRVIDDGWDLMVPKLGSDDKPERVRVTQVNTGSALHGKIARGPDGGFSVIHPTWGDEHAILGQRRGDNQPPTVFFHYGVTGDWLAMGMKDGGEPDDKDIYRIANKFFRNTYSLDIHIL